jgi:2-hydroxy-3-keto-5-methylthiopentenyl-1-phosphate phosphatase
MKRRQVSSECVLVDFDGSVAPDDPTDRLLERFADPSWRGIEAAWQRGDISSRDCLTRQVALLRATPDALDEMVGTFRIDPGFPAFVDFCRRRGMQVKIVSDGFDRVISAVLHRAELSVPFFANKLEWLGGDRWQLTLPHFRSGCRSMSANCKCSHTLWSETRAHIVVGDGRSDICMSTRADFVIAKGTLSSHCRERGHVYSPFVDFHDVTDSLSAWLSKSERAIRSKPSLLRRPDSTAS